MKDAAIEILGEINIIRETLGMDANYFYPALITIIIALLSSVKGIGAAIDNKWKNNLLQLYKYEENDFFYIKVMGVEFILFLVSLLGSMFFLVVVACFIPIIGRQTIFNILSVIVSFIFSLILTKKFFTKKRFVRIKLMEKNRFKWLVYVPIITYDIWLLLAVCFSQYVFLSNFIIILMYVFEIIGLFYYRGRYIEYKYSNVTIYTSNGDVIDCDDISKIKRKKNIVIIENKHKVFHIKYEDISKTEYSGNVVVQLKKWF